MIVIRKCLNCREKEYNFNMSVITDEDCERFAYEYVTKKIKRKDFHINGIKVIIRDNKAKIRMFYQEATFTHEVELYLDVFGDELHKYQDDISEIWQGIMSKYYGKKYQDALETKIVIEKSEIQN